MTSPDLARFRRAGATVLAAYLFVIPFSKAAVEIFFPILFLFWWRGWKRFLPAQWKSLPTLHRALGIRLGLYLSVCLFSILYSSHPDLSLRGFIGKTLEYALLFFMAADLIGLPAAPRRAVRALLASGALVALYGLLQEWAIQSARLPAQAVDPIRGRHLDYVRMVGPYENPNDLATFLMVTALLTIAWMAGCKRNRRMFLGLTFLLVGCMIWSQSRGALLGFFLGMILLAVIHRGKKSLGPTVGWAILLGLVFFFLFSRRHLHEMLTLADSASRERAQMWTTAWRMIQDRPLWGHGLNTFMANYAHYAVGPGRNPAYAHNCFLQITAETGLIGLAAFLFFLAGLGRVAWNALTQPAPSSAEELQRRAILEGITAAVLAFLIQSMFDTNLYALRQAVLFWTLSGMLLGMSTSFLRRS